MGQMYTVYSMYTFVYTLHDPFFQEWARALQKFFNRPKGPKYFCRIFNLLKGPKSIFGISLGQVG